MCQLCERQYPFYVRKFKFFIKICQHGYFRKLVVGRYIEHSQSNMKYTNTQFSHI